VNSLYPSDLSDKEWEIIRSLVEQKAGRPRVNDIRKVLNAIFYVNRTGIQWRALPKDYPNWISCYSCFRRFTHSGTWDKILTALREWARLKADKNDQPSVGIIDSQTVQSVQAREHVGYDAGKKKKAENAIFVLIR
jgi:transposase